MGGFALLWHIRAYPITSLRAFERGSNRQFGRQLASFAGWALLVGAWSVLALLRPNGPTRIPSPISTLSTAAALLYDGRLPSAFVESFLRILVGFSIASGLGVFIGWVAGAYTLCNRLLLPANSFLRYIPPTAYVTLLIVYFGVGETYKYAVVFVSVFFFIVQMTVDAVEDVDKKFLEMGLLSGLSRLALLRYVIIPATMPRVVDVLRINLSGAWTFLVAAEIVGAQGGLGHLIAVSQRFGRIEELYVGALSFGLIGILTDFLVQQWSRYFFMWQR